MNELSTCTLPDGRTCAWAEFGDPEGIPLVFLHGTPGGRLGVAQHHERYIRQGFRVIAPERPGYGASDPLPGRRVADVADDTLRAIDACGIERAFVVGGSGGGPHALAVAAAAPERVQAVGILVGAAPPSSEEIRKLVGINRQVIEKVGDHAALGELLGPFRETVLRDGLTTVLTDAPASDKKAWAAQAETAQLTLESALAPGIEGMVDDYIALYDKPWAFELSGVVTPVIWAHGLDDTSVPYTSAERTAGQLRNCRLITWADTGHAPAPDQLGEFYAALLGAALHSR